MSPSRASDRPRPERFAGVHGIDSGTVELVPDRSDPGGWSILVNRVPSSYVHLGDPTRLDFEYMQWAGHVLDVAAPPGARLPAVHVGGAGCTLARYVAATRPGSPQTVFEVDALLVRIMQQAFGLRGVRGLRLKTQDGLEGLRSLPDAYSAVVIRDAFDGSQVPPHLADAGFYAETARVLRADGVYIGNIADTAQVRESRVEAATALEVFTHVAMIAEPGQLRGRRYGNVVLVASQAPLPEDALVRKLAGGAVRARYVEPARVKELVAGVKPRH
ncbi:spermidine synthase [Jiangella rhizosphaerae]|uniref:Spermidine synthase-like protein n=1 Tax=Jiangella rhizosphaerae TaxID=2293569 RepID=A0A418KU05_9ACTN|nr:fused MFS/spermidine synthase [Jiangella rhizosphaerae]RIQ30056.1 spermidine synthase-like protein [Jiangella rhizosphaerae]